MNDLQVLVIMNLRKASSEEVVSNLGNTDNLSDEPVPSVTLGKMKLITPCPQNRSHNALGQVLR
jgi:hypothetical protein